MLETKWKIWLVGQPSQSPRWSHLGWHRRGNCTESANLWQLNDEHTWSGKPPHCWCIFDHSARQCQQPSGQKREAPFFANLPAHPEDIYLSQASQAVLVSNFFLRICLSNISCWYNFGFGKLVKVGLHAQNWDIHCLHKRNLARQTWGQKLYNGGKCRLLKFLRTFNRYVCWNTKNIFQRLLTASNILLKEEQNQCSRAFLILYGKTDTAYNFKSWAWPLNRQKLS